MQKVRVRAYFKCVRILGMSGQHRNVVAEEVAMRLGVPFCANKKTQFTTFIAFANQYQDVKKPKKQWVSRTYKSNTYKSSDAFLMSYEWRRLRMLVLTERGARCECCGASPTDGIVIHVDHIKPRLLYPELALDKTNLQILCNVCNHGKGNWDETDWRQAQHQPHQ